MTDVGISEGSMKAASIHQEECQPREVTGPLIGRGESREHFPSGVSTTAGSRAARTHRFFAKKKKNIRNNETSARLSTSG